jgi:hypothetical protein
MPIFDRIGVLSNEVDACRFTPFLRCFKERLKFVILKQLTNLINRKRGKSSKNSVSE